MIENNIPSQKLKKQLLPRHIRMIAIGGTVGTGIFKGSADTVGLAGPGVIFSYIFAGLLLMIVMGALIEMAIIHPSHNMKDLIEKALGKRFSFIVGSTYCFMWLTVCVIEVIAAGSFLQYWFASIPLWILCLLCSVVLILINAISFDESIPDLASYKDPSEKVAAQRALEYMKLKEGQCLQDILIDKVFVGSCTNGRIEDLRIVASILEGRLVHPEVHMVIVPGSIQVRDQAIHEGLDIIFKKAGADFRQLSGCSMCVGLNEDSMQRGQRSVSTSNRNFEGRQGPGSMTHIASPAVAAASAIMGRIASPSDL